MQKTPIEWTDFSASLLKYRDADGKSVHACVKISPGCAHCYAEAIAGRWEPGRRFTLPMTNDTTPFFDEQEARKILRSKSIAGKMMFVDDMTDLFGDWVPDEIIHQHCATFALRPDVTFQVLTKRSKRMRDYFTHLWPAAGFVQVPNGPAHAARQLVGNDAGHVAVGRIARGPFPNVHLGVSVEDQQRADERIPDLLATPAATRFLSCEPLLAPLHLAASLATRAIHWVIVGGESGHHARPMHPDWVRSIRDQCVAAGVPFFFKQWGEWKIDSSQQLDVGDDGLTFSRDPESSEGSAFVRLGKRAAGRLLDGREWSEFPHAVSPRPESSRGALTRPKGARP